MELWNGFLQLLYNWFSAPGLIPVPVGFPVEESRRPSWEDFLIRMAEDKDSRTEDPTHKKLEDARKKGQVAKSQDFNAAVIFLILALFLGVLLNGVYDQLQDLMYRALHDNLNLSLSEGNLRTLMLDYLWQGLVIVAPFFGLMMILGILANLFQTRFLFSMEPLKPDPKRLNPIKGFQNIFSQKSLVNLIKNLAKMALVGYISYLTLRGMLIPIAGSIHLDSGQNFGFFLELLNRLILNVSIFMVGIGGLDFLYQRYDYKKGLRMTKQEIKEEYKDLEGDPRLKSFRKSKQREMSAQRMMQAVPEATAVITNPTHFAVAILYESGQMEAPLVVAKGQDLVALKIREIAEGAGVPVIENRELARMMYREVEIGQEIPVSMYRAMAEILAVVYKMKKKGV